MSEPNSNDTDHHLLTDDWPGPTTIVSEEVTSSQSQATSTSDEVISNIHDVQREQHSHPNSKECRQQPGLQAPGRASRSAFLNNAPEPNLNLYVQANSLLDVVRNLAGYPCIQTIGFLIFVSCVFYLATVNEYGIQQVVGHVDGYEPSHWSSWIWQKVCGLARISNFCILLGCLVVVYISFKALAPRIQPFPNRPEFTMSRASFNRAIKRLPWSWLDTDAESVGWLNDVLQKFWPAIKEQISMKLDDATGPLHELINKPYFYVRFSKFSMGKNAPTITGVRSPIKGVKEDVMIIEAEFTYDCNADIEIEAKLMFEILGRRFEFPIQPGLKWFFFKLRVRLEFGPLMSQLPLVGGVAVSLIEEPIVDWRTVRTGDLIDSWMFKEFFNPIVRYTLQWPSHVYFNLAKYKPTEAMSLGNPIAVLQIDLHKAYKLASHGGKTPKPFASVEFEGEEQWTPADAETHNPTFNKRMHFTVHDIESHLGLRFFDENEDEHSMASLVVYLPSLIEHGLNGRKLIAQLHHTMTGSMLDSEVVMTIAIVGLSVNESILRMDQRLTTSVYPLAVLTVLIDSATSLAMVGYSEMITPEQRLMVRITVGNQSKVTSIKSRTTIPIWTESFIFTLINPTLEEVTFEVFDMYTVTEKKSFGLIGTKARNKPGKDWLLEVDDAILLASAKLSVSDILRTTNWRVDKSLVLNGHVENARLNVACAVKVTDNHSDIVENSYKEQVELPDNSYHPLSSHPTTEYRPLKVTLTPTDTTMDLQPVIETSPEKVPKKKSFLTTTTILKQDTDEQAI